MYVQKVVDKGLVSFPVIPSDRICTRPTSFAKARSLTSSTSSCISYYFLHTTATTSVTERKKSRRGRLVRRHVFAGNGQHSITDACVKVYRFFFILSRSRPIFPLLLLFSAIETVCIFHLTYALPCSVWLFWLYTFVALSSSHHSRVSCHMTWEKFFHLTFSPFFIYFCSGNTHSCINALIKDSRFFSFQGTVSWDFAEKCQNVRLSSSTSSFNRRFKSQRWIKGQLSHSLCFFLIIFFRKLLSPS